MQVLLQKLLRPLLVLLLLIPAGCAKSPAGGGVSPASGPQLLVTMTVAGNINPNFYYYVLFNVSASPQISTVGPVPVVGTPYGNGFAAGAFNYYVEYNGAQTGGTNFNYYAIDLTLFNSQPLGPSYLIQPQASGNTLTFQLPLAYLATANITAENIQQLDINFITTNIVPTVGDNLNPQKYFDSLYNNNLIAFAPLFVRDVNLNLRSGIYSSSTLGYTGGPVVQAVNGSNLSAPATITAGNGATGNSADLQITGWTIQLTAGS